MVYCPKKSRIKGFCQVQQREKKRKGYDLGSPFYRKGGECWGKREGGGGHFFFEIKGKKPLRARESGIRSRPANKKASGKTLFRQDAWGPVGAVGGRGEPPRKKVFQSRKQRFPGKNGLKKGGLPHWKKVSKRSAIRKTG